MKTIQSKKLKLLLNGNGWFTLSSAILILVFSSPLQDIFNISNSLFLWLLAIGLSLYALDLYFTVRKGNINIRKAYYFVIADFLWVIASVLAISIFNLSPFGILIISIVAFIVGTFGFLQLNAIRG